MKILFFLLASFGLLGIPAWAQVDTGQISGTVVDNTKAAVPGVKITATNEETRVAVETTTNSSGYYTFSNLPVGTYSVAAEAAGFQKYVRTGLHLDANHIVRGHGTSSVLVGVELRERLSRPLPQRPASYYIPASTGVKVTRATGPVTSQFQVFGASASPRMPVW